MLVEHFSFVRKPFVATPDHRELFQSQGHQELRARLRIALEEQQLSLVFGEHGVGKSTSLRSVIAELDARKYRVIEVFDPRLKLRSFYRILANGLGLQPRFFFGDLSGQVRAELQQTDRRHPLLVVDDAQMLTEDALDSLRLLSNPGLGQTRPGISLLLVGDMTLCKRLKRPYFRAFVQRLRMTYRFPPVDLDEGRRYIAHRLRVAGGNPDVFEPTAVEKILHEAEGSLRSIDDICIKALFAAVLARQPVVTQDHANTAIAERQLLHT